MSSVSGDFGIPTELEFGMPTVLDFGILIDWTLEY